MEKKKKEDKYYLPRDISWMYFCTLQIYTPHFYVI